MTFRTEMYLRLVRERKVPFIFNPDTAFAVVVVKFIGGTLIGLGLIFAFFVIWHTVSLL